MQADSIEQQRPGRHPEGRIVVSVGQAEGAQKGGPPARPRERSRRRWPVIVEGHPRVEPDHRRRPRGRAKMAEGPPADVLDDLRLGQGRLLARVVADDAGAGEVAEPGRSWAFRPVANPSRIPLPPALKRLKNVGQTGLVQAGSTRPGWRPSRTADRRTLSAAGRTRLVACRTFAGWRSAKNESDTLARCRGEGRRPAEASPTTASRWGGTGTGSTSPATPTRRGTSSSRTRNTPGPIRHRDYVVRSLNEDKPPTITSSSSWSPPTAC